MNSSFFPSLATAGYGTALGVIRALHSEGVLERAYCTETRPFNQVIICIFGSVIVANKLCITKRGGEHLLRQSLALRFHESFRKYRKAA